LGQFIEKASKGEKLQERCWYISRKIRVTLYDNVTVAFYSWLVCPIASVTVKATEYGSVTLYGMHASSLHNTHLLFE